VREIERIVAAAIKYDGVPYALPAPARHNHVIKAVSEFVTEANWPVDQEQGFMTSSGRFVNRHIAMRIAIQAKQLPKGARPWLASEDIW
jgi:hypothetical protein